MFDIALSRSEENLNTAFQRLLELTCKKGRELTLTLGITQEYFLIDRNLFLLRPDLVLSGRTVFGAHTGIGRSLEGCSSDRARLFMRDLEMTARQRGIPIDSSCRKKPSLAIVENLTLMELMRESALKHDLACLFDEKPFVGIKGSSKHLQFSIGGDFDGDPLVHMTLLTALLRSVHEHTDLLKACIGSVDNGFFLREESVLSIDFGFSSSGSFAQLALAVSVLQAILANHLMLILDEIGSSVGDLVLNEEELFAIFLPILQSHQKRGQPVVHHTIFDCFKQFLEKKSVAVLEGVFSENELAGLYETSIKQYVETRETEVDLMIDLFQTQILPAAQKDMRERGIEEPLIEQAILSAAELKKCLSQMADMGFEAKGKIFSELMGPKMDDLRSLVDRLEGVVDDALWPLPKYRELLFIQ